MFNPFQPSCPFWSCHSGPLANARSFYSTQGKVWPTKGYQGFQLEIQPVIRSIIFVSPPSFLYFLFTFNTVYTASQFCVKQRSTPSCNSVDKGSRFQYIGSTTTFYISICISTLPKSRKCNSKSRPIS